MSKSAKSLISLSRALSCSTWPWHPGQAGPEATPHAATPVSEPQPATLSKMPAAASDGAVRAADVRCFTHRDLRLQTALWSVSTELQAECSTSCSRKSRKGYTGKPCPDQVAQLLQERNRQALQTRGQRLIAKPKLQAASFRVGPFALEKEEDEEEVGGRRR